MSIWLPKINREPDNRPPIHGPAQPATQLFCFPHAGGGVANYHRWDRLLPDWIDLLPVKLPGRESRFNEPAVGNLHELLDRMVPAIVDHIREPFAMFGHSMGGLIAYELTVRLQQHGLQPQVLFLSACRAPHRFNNATTKTKLHTLPDDEMIEYLARDYGKGGKLSNDESQMMLLMSNTIRADLKLLETYEHSGHEPLSIPIMGLAASEDRKVTLEDVSGWREHTSGSFKLRTIPGHHFYLREQEKSLAALVAATLTSLTTK